MSARHPFMERLGFPAPEPERALWFIADSREAFESIAPTVATVRRRYGRLRVLLSTSDDTLRSWLIERFPDCRVTSLPADFGPSAGSFLQRSNIRVAVFVDCMGDPPRALLRELRRRAIAIVALGAHGRDRLKPGSALAVVCESVIEIDETRVPDTAAEGRPRRLGVEPAVELLGEMLARDLKPLRRNGSGRHGLGAALNALSRNDRWRHRLAWRLKRYIDLGELSEALQAPRTILCLGNGPSSENSRLTGMAYDALFRVNHSWLRRGFLARADVVFTGGKPTMRAIGGSAILGLQTANAEERFAAMCPLNPLLGRLCFFNVHDITPDLTAFEWGNLRPTNGASMLATAVALAPAQLIVAGIDLFQHPEGSYPGDPNTPNAYSPGHSLDTELGFILQLLARYPGELIIVGEVLQSEWEKYKKRQKRAEIEA